MTRLFLWRPVAPRGPPWPPVAGFLINRPFWRLGRPILVGIMFFWGGGVRTVASRGLPWPLVASGAPWPPMALRIGYAIQDMRDMKCDT